MDEFEKPVEPTPVEPTPASEPVVPAVVYEKPIMTDKGESLEEVGARGARPLFGVNATTADMDELVRAFNLEAAISLDDDDIVKGLSAKSREVYDSIMMSAKLTAVYDAMYGNLTERPEAKWRQTLQHEGTRIAPSVNAIKEGSSPLDIVVAAAGISHGRSRIFPLHNSGIWIELSAPTPNEWVLLRERISQEKLDMALATSGVSLSNNDVYQRAAIVNFILDHVIWTTAPNKDVNYLKSIIQVTDYIPLAAYMASMIYPTGYDYLFQCVADPEKCTEVHSRNIDILRTVWNDMSLLTEKQLKLMASRRTARHEEILDYQAEFNNKVSSSLPINDNVQIRFRIPSLAEAEDEGMGWITEMQSRTNDAFGRRLDGEQRSDFLRRMAISDRLVTYVHFIDSIVGYVNDQEGVITDRGDINATLRALGQNEEFATKISEFRRQFVFNRQVSVVANVREPCTACGAYPPKEEYMHSDLITLDPVYLFTTLLDRRVEEFLTPR